MGCAEVATQYESNRRQFLRDVTCFGGGLIVLSGCTEAPPSGDGQGSLSNGLQKLPDVEGGEIVTDPARFPARFNESPEFAALVSAGKLPPVAERIGRDPLVIKPVQQIGKYGGTLRRGFLGVGDHVNGMRFCAGPDNLLYWDYRMRQVIPNIARHFEQSDDDRVLVLHLRRGMRWSDGIPFTADDLVFWRDDISLNENIGSAAVLRMDGKEVAVRKIDDHTVEFVSPAPNPLLPALLAGYTDIGGMAANSSTGGGGFAPKHYLSRFHPAYTSEKEANKVAADAGFNDWAAYFKDRNTWHLNAELPALTPWVVTQPISRPPWTFQANPYSVWVDTEGNQLPYIRTIRMGNAENTEAITLRTVAGEYDFQDRHLTVASLPVLLQNQQRSRYTVHRAPLSEMDFGVRINLAYDEDTVLGELIRTTDFRRALSLGVDRSQLNAAFFLSTSRPSATMAADDSRYFPGPQWRTMWATHDPARANALLDRIGLTAKDGAGYRLRPDGTGRIRLDYQSVRSFNDFPRMGEMIKEHWRAIGIDLTVATVDPTLLTQRSLSNELMLSGHQVGTDDPFLRPDTLLPTVTNAYAGMIGIPYAKWFATNGGSGVEPPRSVGRLKDAMALYRKGLRSSDEERVAIGQEIFKLHADQVWTIGVVGFGLGIYGIYTADNRLGNVPRRILNTLHQKTPSNALPMTFYYK
jgi:peptide/nickel transport system substrate-binding protein